MKIDEESMKRIIEKFHSRYVFNIASVKAREYDFPMAMYIATKYLDEVVVDRIKLALITMGYVIEERRDYEQRD